MLGSVAVAHWITLYGTLRRNSGWFGPLTTEFGGAADEVWLTIDDGPEPRDTPGMLEVLARHEALATFFMIGRKVDRERELARRVAGAGHGIGNHTYSHPAGAFWTLPPGMMRREIVRGADAIEVATGVRPRLFRSPVGLTNPFVHPVLRSEGAQLVGWSASGFDGLGDRGEVVVSRILNAARPGGILVLHEGGGPGRVETLDLLLTRLKARGLRCVLPGMGTSSQTRSG
ncbi:MAG: polysaccharide deacetylase family protein [Chthoniobacterales bacterium]